MRDRRRGRGTDDGPPIEELIGGMPDDQRQLLRAGGMSVERLREMASTEEGAHQVRVMLTYSDPANDDRAPGSAPAGGIARRWLVLLAAAVFGVALSLGLAVLVGKPAFIAGLGYAILVLPLLASRIRSSRGSAAATALLVLGFLLPAVLGPLNVADWYLAVAGRQARATVAAPARHEDRDSVTVACRVRLPDGAVREVDHSDGRCAREVGGTTDVVYDPSGWFAPHLGTAAGLSADTTGMVAAAGFAVMLLAPLTVISVGARGRENEAGR